MRTSVFVLCCLVADVAQACNVTVPTSGNIQSAINSLAPSGGVVCLATGTHATAGINLGDNITLRGTGTTRSQTIVVLASASNRHVIEAWGVDPVVIENLTVDGNGSNQTAGTSAGIAIESSSNATVDNIEIQNTDIMNMIIRNSTFVEVLNSAFSSMNANGTQSPVQAVWIGDTGYGGNNYIYFHDNLVYGNGNGPGGDGSVDCYGSDHVNVYDNYLQDVGASSIYFAYGVTAGHGCRDGGIWSNDINNSGEWGIDVVGGSNNTYVGANYIDDSYFGSMVFWNVSTATVEYNQMTNGNSSGYAACRGINIQSSTGVSVTGTNWVDSGPLSC